MDISRLKKRIQTLCERMEKGGSLVSSDSYSDRGNSTECSLRQSNMRSHRHQIDFSVPFLIASYSASSTSNPKGRSSSSSAGYSSHREMNNGEDEENGLPTDDHGSMCQRIISANRPLFDGLSSRYIPSPAIDKFSPNHQRGRWRWLILIRSWTSTFSFSFALSVFRALSLPRRLAVCECFFSSRSVQSSFF